MESTPESPTLPEGYNPAKLRDVSIPLEAVAQQITVLSIVLTVAPLVIHALLWGVNTEFQSEAYLFGFVLTFVLIVLHELCHAIGWIIFARVPASHISFGFAWKTLSPYAHAKTPMRADGYRGGVVLPGILTGLLPTLAGILTGQAWLTVPGAVLLSGALGDALVWWVIRDVPGDALVIDHPKNAGCYVIEAE
jgi:hypothetical protein